MAIVPTIRPATAHPVPVRRPVNGQVRALPVLRPVVVNRIIGSPLALVSNRPPLSCTIRRCVAEMRSRQRGGQSDSGHGATLRHPSSGSRAWKIA